VRRKSVLILLENLSIPADRRAWREATTLAENGWQVTAVCPKGVWRDKASLEVVEGVEIHRYDLEQAPPGMAAYLREYSVMLWHSVRLALRLYGRKRFTVIQGGNPPDLFFLVALLFRPLGVKYVFDHRDANPELFHVKFGSGARVKDAVYRAVLLVERLSFRFSDHVLSPNESFRQIAITRGRKHPDHVTVVRGGPLRDEFIVPIAGRTGVDVETRAEHSIGFLGVMGSQDGVDVLLDATAELVRRRGAGYVAVEIFGDGEMMPALRRQCSGLGLDVVVTFHGFQPTEVFVPRLAACDVLVAPDPPNEFNDIITMNKVIEYMSLGRPVVSFDLTETKALVRDAGVAVVPATAGAYADALEQLLDDPARCDELGRRGSQRFEQELGWERSAPALLAAYRRVDSLARD
jgi:glycosyltransferase involved in cell wall biosynthesis